MKQHVWWTGPGEDDCVHIDVKDDEVIIWQYLRGDIKSINVNRATAEEIANYLHALL